MKRLIGTIKGRGSGTLPTMLYKALILTCVAGEERRKIDSAMPQGDSPEAIVAREIVCDVLSLRLARTS
jgi:hypothetical protein